MAKLHAAMKEPVAGYEAFAFHCPGCGHAHMYWTKVPAGDPRSVWQFNGNFDRPSFQPSLLNTFDAGRCHLLLTDGKINFCSDCTHPLAGQTVECPEWPE